MATVVPDIPFSTPCDGGATGVKATGATCPVDVTGSTPVDVTAIVGPVGPVGPAVIPEPVVAVADQAIPVKMSASHMIQLQKAFLLLQEAIVNGTVMASPMTLLQEAYKIASSFPALSMADKKEMAMFSLDRLACGADGIAGTADDLIPADVMDKIRILFDSQIIDGMIDFIADMKMPDCLPRLFPCFCKPKAA
jgi:hypothetical protein